MEYLSDKQIARQYANFNVTFLHLDESKCFDCRTGCIEIEFPNATHPDFDSSIVDNFICYDLEGKRIAFDHWFPEEVYYNLCQMIRKEIKKVSA